MTSQDTTPAPRGAAFEFWILGQLEVLRDGVALPLPGPRPRALLAVLLVHANERVSSDRLAEDVWDGRPPATARSALQMHVHALRQALGADLPLRTVPGGYVLRVGSDGTDASAFERSVADGREALSAGCTEEASQRLRAALSLWRGSALAEFTDASFARLEAERLEEVRLLALEMQFDADLALGRHGELVPELTRLVAAHPARERLHAQLIRALYRGGRQADALAEFQRARHYLVEELGLEPSAELQRLQAAVLAQDPALELAAAVPGPAPSHERAPPIPTASRSALGGERKQVTVLFCGVAGSTALTQALGPEGTHRVFGSLFRLALKKVQLYEGTISQFLGDGFMALFGAPIAHEDHARRAVLAALAIRDALKHADVGMPPGRRIELRMGANSGEVVVGSLGDGLPVDYTAFGETSLLASRLQAAARPDEILMSVHTAQLVEGYVLAETAEPVQVKDHVVSPMRLLGVGPRLSRVHTAGGRARRRCVGREEEVAALRRLLEDVRAGRGRLATITGEPGIGKSRVLLEVREAAAGLGLTYLEGRCLSFGRSIAYLPVVDLLRERCGIVDEEAGDVVADKLAGSLRAVKEDVDRALPYLLRVQGLRHDAGEIATLDPATVRARTFDVLQRLLLGDTRWPLVLAVEDLQWIDRTSEDFFHALSETVLARPVLLVGTSRPEYSPPWSKDVADEFRLRPLSRSESAAVVSSHLSERCPETVRRAIIDRGEGNPLFLEELTGAVREHGKGAALGVPGTLQSVLAARIDRLPAQAKRVLQTASVLGRRFPLAYLEHLWDEPGALSQQLALLTERDFVHRVDGERPTVWFKHALTQEVAYGSLLLAHRQALHAHAGAVLETLHVDRLEQYVELLAHHYDRSDDAESAFRYLERANAKAAQANAMEEATAYFYRALKALDRLPDSEDNRRRRLRILLDQTGEFHLLHRHREYYELLVEHEQLARGLGDPGLLGEFYARLGHRQWTVFADMAQAVRTLTRAARLCERADRPIGAASAYAILEWSFLFTGPLDGVDRHLHKARAKLDEEFHPHWYMWALAAAVLAHTYAGRWRAAIAAGEEAVALGERRGEDGIVSFAAAWLAYARLAQGDWHGAIAYAELGLASAPTIYFQGFSQAHLAAAFCHTQNAEQGVPILKAISEMLRVSEHRPGWMHVASLLAEGQLEQSDVDAAAATAEEVADVSGRAHARYYVTTSQRLLAEAALIRGDLSKAERHVENSLSVARQLGAENALALAQAVRGRVRLRRGETGGAQRDLRESLEVFERLGTVGFPRHIRDDAAAVRG